MTTLKSVSKCKLCNKDIVTTAYGRNTTAYGCKFCNHYSFIINRDGILESELISFGNFYLIFFPQFKEANVVSAKDGKNERLHRIELEELTPELAVHWANKLKTYAIFQ